MDTLKRNYITRINIFNQNGWPNQKGSIHHTVCKQVDEIVTIFDLHELVIHDTNNFVNPEILYEFFQECVKETVGDPFMIQINNTATIIWQENKNKKTFHLFVNDAGLLISEGVQRLIWKGVPLKNVYYHQVTRSKAKYFFQHISFCK